MASIRKRGGSYLIVVSMGYDHTGKRLKSQQKTVKPPAGLTNRQTEKWLNEQATLFEMECKSTAPVVDKKDHFDEFWHRWADLDDQTVWDEPSYKPYLDYMLHTRWVEVVEDSE